MINAFHFRGRNLSFNAKPAEKEKNARKNADQRTGLRRVLCQMKTEYINCRAEYLYTVVNGLPADLDADKVFFPDARPSAA